MAKIMTYQEWMSRTCVDWKIRGPALRALDNAILSFHDSEDKDKGEAYFTLEKRLADFIKEKSGGFFLAVNGQIVDMNTIRDGNKINGVGPVQELFTQVSATRHDHW